MMMIIIIDFVDLTCDRASIKFSICLKGMCQYIRAK